jgi:branched-chain amino acid transport system substrate-binding protein
MKRKQHVRVLAGLAAMAMVAASCGSDSDSSSDTAAPDSTEAAVDDTVADTEPTDTEATEPTDTEPTDTETTEPTDTGGDGGFLALAPATGEPIVIGMVNTEGSPGLDFPEISTNTLLAAEFLNEHGGMGGRPVEIELCTAAGSPETSQECAQELAGKDVELVMLGLDLFPGYDTFTASDIPVTGILPILPGDYTANALFLGGGNATTTAAMAAFAEQNFDAQSIGIVSADNAGANGTEASLIAALDAAGIPYKSVKGGDNETDAGFQGLMREATTDNPDVLISLYADAGCIGTMRGRAALGITTPVITTAICASAEVIDVVGDEAEGWYFVGVGTPQLDTPEAADTLAVIEPTGATNTSQLGLGALGLNGLLTLANVANLIADDGGDVTGASIYERLQGSDGVLNWPDGNPLSCGAAPAYPTICNFVFVMGEYSSETGVKTVPGFEALNTTDYLP